MKFEDEIAAEDEEDEAVRADKAAHET